MGYLLELVQEMSGSLLGFFGRGSTEEFSHFVVYHRICFESALYSLEVLTPY